MLAINPGFAFLAGALLVLATPGAWRGWVMSFAAFAAIVLMFSPDFGEGGAFAQVGLELAFLSLDATSQVFALALAVVGLAVAMASFSRRDRLEDGALMLHVGGACMAACAGDLVTFVAAAELSALAGVALIASRAQAGRVAALRMLAWHAIAGTLLLAGAAFHLAAGEQSRFSALDRDTVGGALFLAGLGMRAGFPLAHVGLKDAAPHASDVGFPALLAVTPALAVYGLMRGYSGDVILVVAGLAMGVIAAVFAFSQYNFKKGMAYAVTGQFGLALAAAGLGAPIASAGAAAVAFVTIIAAALFAIAAFGVREGGPGASRWGVGLAWFAGFSMIGAPGAAGYIGLGLVLDAAGRDHRDYLWAAIAALAAAACAYLVVRAPLALWTTGRSAGRASVPFPVMLAGLLLGFVCFAIGMAPEWLLALCPPGGVVFYPYAWGSFAPIAQVVSGAAALALLASAFGLMPRVRPGDGADIDDRLTPLLSALADRVQVTLDDVGRRWRDGVNALRDGAERRAQALLSDGDRPARGAVLSDAAALLALAVAAFSVILALL
jgi:multicomponent Na+:H+ antiporter subunit D